MAISPELNRERVRKSQEKVDRINIYLPKGTADRINDLGFKSSTFCRNAIITELERLESMKK